MRTLRLARLAAAAEGLRLRQALRRAVIRAAFTGLATVFILGAIGFLHFAVFMRLARSEGTIVAALIVAGGDLLIAIICALPALYSGPGAVEREALLLREQVRLQMMRSLDMAALLAAVLARLFPSRKG